MLVKSIEFEEKSIKILKNFQQLDKLCYQMNLVSFANPQFRPRASGRDSPAPHPGSHGGPPAQDIPYQLRQHPHCGMAHQTLVHILHSGH